MKYLVRPLAPLLIGIGAAILILTAGAEIVSAVIINRRSTQRMEEAESALRESEERLRLIANNVPALISYVDREQRYRYSNRTYDDWFAIPHEGMHGRTIAEVFGDEAYGRMRPDIERVLGGANVQFELTMGDGTKRRILQVACVPHLGPEAEVLGFYVLANDVTQL